MKLLQFIFIASLFVTLLISCDPGVDYSRIVQNSSSYDLFLIHEFDSIYDTAIIEKNSEYSVYAWDAIGRTSEYENCHPEQLGSFSLKVIGYDSLNIVIDLNNPTLWTFSVLDKTVNGGGKCECRIIISDFDIN
jgi:hypothetical protein